MVITTRLEVLRFFPRLNFGQTYRRSNSLLVAWKTLIMTCAIYARMPIETSGNWVARFNGFYAEIKRLHGLGVGKGIKMHDIPSNSRASCDRQSASWSTWGLGWLQRQQRSFERHDMVENLRRRWQKYLNQVWHSKKQFKPTWQVVQIHFDLTWVLGTLNWTGRMNMQKEGKKMLKWFTYPPA